MDRAAEAYIAWEPFASELLAEMRERIRSQWSPWRDMPISTAGSVYSTSRSIRSSARRGRLRPD
jgi:hypothetical protein